MPKHEMSCTLRSSLNSKNGTEMKGFYQYFWCNYTFKKNGI